MDLYFAELKLELWRRVFSSFLYEKLVTPKDFWMTVARKQLDVNVIDIWGALLKLIR